MIFYYNRMQNQKSAFTSLISPTSRQFYTRRVTKPHNSSVQFDKVLRLLNGAGQPKTHRKTRTEAREEGFCAQEDLQNVKKIAYVKLNNTIKRGSGRWKELLEMFNNYTKSSSREQLRYNQVNFLGKLNQLLVFEQKERAREEEVRRGKGGRPVQKKEEGQFHFLESIRLEKENQMLREQLQHLQKLYANYTPILQQPTKSKKQSSQCQNQCPFTTQGYNSLQAEVEFLRQSNDLLRDQKKSQNQKIAELKASNQNLCEEIVKCRFFSSENKQKVEQWKNIMMMQGEQIGSLKRDIADLKYELNILGKKYSNVLRRVGVTSNDQNKLKQISKKNVQVFSQQIDFFQRVRLTPLSKAVQQLATPLDHHHLPTQNNHNNNPHYKKYMPERDTINNPEGIKKLNKEFMRYYKPTYFIYIEQYLQHQGIDRDNIEQIQLSIGISFLTTVRAILDAKYNQYIMNRENGKLVGNMSVFVLGWLSSFRIGFKSRKVEEVVSDVNLDTLSSFYVKLMSPYLNNKWEIIAFRQFLLQTATVDELVFYLKARFKLLQGDGAAGCGAYTDIYYVKYMDALVLVQEVVADFGYRKKLQEYLKKNCEVHRKNHLVDAYFILRILLEYYQHKKTQIFSQLSKTFNKYLKQFNNHMHFQTYLKIYDYDLFDMTLQEKIQIYHKAFSIGKGKVQLEYIFAVMNQEGYLCRVAEGMFERQSIVRENGSYEAVILRKEAEEVEENVVGVFGKIVEEREVAALGLEELTKVVRGIKKSNKINFQSLLQQFQTIFSLAIFQMQKMFLTKSLKEQQLLRLIPTFLSFFRQISAQTIEKKRAMDFRSDFLKKNAAKVIMNFYRRKKKMRNNLIATADGITKAQEKSNNVRLEFINLIQNLKKKYHKEKKDISDASSSEPSRSD